MTGRNIIGLQFHRPSHKRSELHSLITEDTGIGGSPLNVFLAEILDDLPLKLISHMEDIKRNPKLKGNTPRIFNVRNSTTSCRAFLGFVRHPDAHRCPDDLIPSFFKKKSGEARINPAAHSHHNP